MFFAVTCPLFISFNTLQYDLRLQIFFSSGTYEAGKKKWNVLFAPLDKKEAG